MCPFFALGRREGARGLRGTFHVKVTPNRFVWTRTNPKSWALHTGGCPGASITRWREGAGKHAEGTHRPQRRRDVLPAQVVAKEQSNERAGRSAQRIPRVNV